MKEMLWGIARHPRQWKMYACSYRCRREMKKLCEAAIKRMTGG